MCRIKNQASGKVIEKGLKWDIYFLSSFPFICLFLSVVLRLLIIVMYGIRNWDIPILLFWLILWNIVIWAIKICFDLLLCLLIMVHVNLVKASPYPFLHMAVRPLLVLRSFILPYGALVLLFHMLSTNISWYLLMIIVILFGYFYFFCSKADVFFVFQIVYAENQFSTCIKTLRWFWEEYMSNGFQFYL